MNRRAEAEDRVQRLQLDAEDLAKVKVSWWPPSSCWHPRQGFVDLHTVVGDAPSIQEALERLEGAPRDHLRLELACLRPSLVGAAT